MPAPQQALIDSAAVPDPAGLHPVKAVICPRATGFWFRDATGSWIPIATRWLSRQDREAIAHLLNVQNQEEDQCIDADRRFP